MSPISYFFCCTIEDKKNQPSIEKTPIGLTNLNAFRNQCTNLTKHYVHTVSTPTHAGFLTGEYAFLSWSVCRAKDYEKPTYLSERGLKVAKNKN